MCRLCIIWLIYPLFFPFPCRGTGKEATLSKAIFGSVIGGLVVIVALVMTLALTLSVGDARLGRSAPTLLIPLVGGGVDVPEQVAGPEYPPPLPVPPRLPAEVFPIPPGPSAALTASATGQLRFALSGLRANGQPRVVARSYDNLPWEAMRDEDMQPMQVRCTSATSAQCTLYGTAAPTYAEGTVPPEAATVDATGRAARLLSQFSFGATKAEIIAAAAQTPDEWMQSQMSLTPSLLRSHVRKRQNPRPQLLTDLGNLHGICSPGARYTPVTSGGSGANTQTLAAADLQVQQIGNTSDVAIVRASNCDPYKFTGLHEAFIVHSGQRYRHDPRLLLLRNSPGLPAGGIPGQMCPSVPSTFVNAWSCVRRASCGLASVTSVELLLDATALRRWYTGSQRYVYTVKNLRLEAPFDVTPCSGVSRWERSAGNCPAPSALDGTTTNIITTALTNTLDSTNPFVRDIELPGPAGCTAAPGVSLTVNGECFTHVHPNQYQVRDFTDWGGPGMLHPGNTDNGVPRTPNPIYKWAENGGTDLPWPASHPLTRWGDANLRHIPVVGRLGDSVDFLALTGELQSPDMSVYAGAAGAGEGIGAFESCGSPGEMGNDGSLGHRYIIPREDVEDEDHSRMLDFSYSWSMGKSMAWMNNALLAPDQLRQRAAWALQQIFTIGDNDSIQQTLTDTWASYSDIFVRNAFGNYRQIMKEVAYHPLVINH